MSAASCKQDLEGRQERCRDPNQAADACAPARGGCMLVLHIGGVSDPGVFFLSRFHSPQQPISASAPTQLNLAKSSTSLRFFLKSTFATILSVPVSAV